MHVLDITALLTRIAGLGILASDASFSSSITTLFGVHGPGIIAGIGLASIVATDILRISGAPSGSVHVIAGVVEPQLTVPNFNDIPPSTPPKAS